MSRRIEIELTSRTPEGAYTWRAAGAKQPRGTLGADLLPEGTEVGAVVRAEIESGLDGFEVVAVTPPLPRSEEPDTNRIEVLGAPRRGPEVSVSYAPGARRGGERRGVAAGPASGRRERSRPAARRAGGEGPTTREDRGGRTRTATRREPHDGGERRGPPARTREHRPHVSTAHRNALLATLGPQELPIAEQLVRGGIPAVRQALAEQRAGVPPGVARAATANRDTVLALADQLLPKVNLATWKDRATSAQAAGKELRLRELRAVVTSSRTVMLDDEARALARALQGSLDERVRVLREEWLSRMGKALDAGRVVDALTVAARPAELQSRLPAEVAVRLTEAAGAAMTEDTDPAEWLSLLQAVVESPVRRTVKPRGIPAAPEAQDAARRAAGSVPELAKLLGLRIPPPPPRRPPTARHRVMAAGGAAPAAGS